MLFQLAQIVSRKQHIINRLNTYMHVVEGYHSANSEVSVCFSLYVMIWIVYIGNYKIEQDYNAYHQEESHDDAAQCPILR